MTVLSGNVTKVETLTQFKEQMQLSWADIVSHQGDDVAEELLSRFNKCEEEGGYPTADSLSEPPVGDEEHFEVSLKEDLIHHTQLKSYTIITNVLEGEDQRYVHLYNSPIHTIVEVYDEDPVQDTELEQTVLDDIDRIHTLAHYGFEPQASLKKIADITEQWQ